MLASGAKTARPSLATDSLFPYRRNGQDALDMPTARAAGDDCGATTPYKSGVEWSVSPSLPPLCPVAPTRLPRPMKGREQNSVLTAKQPTLCAPVTLTAELCCKRVAVSSTRRAAHAAPEITTATQPQQAHAEHSSHSLVPAMWPHVSQIAGPTPCDATSGTSAPSFFFLPRPLGRCGATGPCRSASLMDSIRFCENGRAKG